MPTDFAALTAHQFFQGLCWPQADLPSAIAPAPPPVPAKVNALCHVLEALSATDSGWPANKPQTADNLLPYVIDEVEELLEVLQATAIAAASADEAATVAAPTPAPQLLATLSTEWVWAIAASQLTAMTLLEGVAASSRDQPAAYGVRLMPILTIQTEKADYTLDLAAQSLSPPAPEFAPNDPIQLLDETAGAIASATVWKRQIQADSTALVPSLQTWYAGTTVDLCLPSAAWFTAQVQLDLRLVPLTVQVSSASAASRVAFNPETAGLPTARVWQAESAPAAACNVVPSPVAAMPDAAPWTLDAELSFVQPEALIEARHATQCLASQQQVMTHWHTAAATPLSLLETVIAARSSAEPDLTWGAAPLPLAALCNQVKWLWIRAHQGQVALMSGLEARRLRSGQAWQSGLVTTYGHLVFLSDQQPLAALDVATATWTPPDPQLLATDWLQLTAPPGSLPSLGMVAQFTQTVNQMVRSRSPLLAALMAGQPITLWSPQDDLFPERTPPDLQLQFQIGLTFLASLP